MRWANFHVLLPYPNKFAFAFFVVFWSPFPATETLMDIVEDRAMMARILCLRVHLDEIIRPPQVTIHSNRSELEKLQWFDNFRRKRGTMNVYSSTCNLFTDPYFVALSPAPQTEWIFAWMALTMVTSRSVDMCVRQRTCIERKYSCAIHDDQSIQQACKSVYHFKTYGFY
jgi:hypothetical protein